jgi:hypothetical protein
METRTVKLPRHGSEKRPAEMEKLEGNKVLSSRKLGLKEMGGT